MKNLEKYFNTIFNQKKSNIRKLDENSINFKLDNSEMQNLKKKITDIISNNEKKKFKKFKDVYQFLNKTKFYKIEKNLDDYVNLENIILNILKKRKLVNKYIYGIEFPAGIRILHPYTPQQLKGKFLTSSLHCDPWAGEPEDMINIVMYLEVSEKTPLLMIKNTDKNDIKKNRLFNNFYKSRLFLNSKKYFKNLNKFESLKTHKINHKNGEVYLFKGFVPHSTIKQGSKVRLGLELRLRTNDIYKNTKRFLSKINNSGRYWSIPKQQTLNFHERSFNEIQYISKNYKEFNNLIKLRKTHIKKFL